LAALARHEDALSSLERARADALAVQRPTVIWPVERALGRLYHAMRQPDEADTHFQAAREIIESIADQNPDEDLRERFRAGALGTLPRPRTMTQNQQAKARFGGLTAREREVAALVARGLSNREIADELVLGERTIETHVGNILGKLDFSSRAQVAAWAVQTGLAEHA
jgi:DNA-binding NarL/FixJ family response regulator